MQHLSEEQRGVVERKLLDALDEALMQLQHATPSEQQTARTKYQQALEDFSNFVLQYPVGSLHK
jgi:hypothetical protein